MALQIGKAYYFTNVGAPGRSLCLYPYQTSNGTNVVLRATNSNAEAQQWIWTTQKRLQSVLAANKCLDRYNSSGNSQHNNADLWASSTSEDVNQEISIFESTSYVRIKLLNTNLYLTAYNNASGTGSGNTTTSSGNVYWAASSTSNLQRWTANACSSSASYKWPTESRNVTQDYSGSHNGIDIGGIVAGENGDRVFAFMSGTVTMANSQISTNPNEGYTVRIRHSNPLAGNQYLRTQYMHLSQRALVNEGDTVSAGQLIGYMGNTGNSSGTHLHFETRTKPTPFLLKSEGGVYAEGTVVDPNDYLDLT